MKHSIKSWLRPNTNGLPFGERWLTYDEKVQREHDYYLRYLGICSVIVVTLVLWYFGYLLCFGK